MLVYTYTPTQNECPGGSGIQTSENVPLPDTGGYHDQVCKGVNFMLKSQGSCSAARKQTGERVLDSACRKISMLKKMATITENISSCIKMDSLSAAH